MIVSAVFPPEPAVSAQTSAQIASELAQRGHQVTVIAPFPSRPAGRLYPGYHRRLFQRERGPQSFDVMRCFSTLAPESRLGTRFAENLTFGVTSGIAVLSGQKPAVIYANTWPVFASSILAMVARLRNIPLVLSIQDVYPESLVSQKRIGANGWLARSIRGIDGWIARGSQAVILISNSAVNAYITNRGVRRDRLHLIPNWGDTHLIVPDDEHADEFRARLDIPSTATVILYGGNVGMASGIETVIESFRDLVNVPDLYLVIAGEGSNLAACQILARRMGNPRIIFYTPWPSTETSMVLSAADILILPTRSNQSLASMPSKLIAYMLAARPVIALALAKSDLVDIMGQSGCGWYVEPDAPDQLAAKIRDVLRQSRDEREQRGRAGRVFALQNLSREICLPKAVEVIERVACSQSA